MANLLARRESGDLHLAQPSSEDNAALVTSLAAAHWAQASESRLGHKAAPFKQPLNPNLMKAMTLVAEQRTKKKEASIMDKKAGPKISVTLWTSLGESHLFKMEKVQPSCYRHFPEPDLMFSWLDWSSYNFKSILLYKIPAWSIWWAPSSSEEWIANPLSTISRNWLVCFPGPIQ